MKYIYFLSIKNYVHKDTDKHVETEYALDDVLKCVLQFSKTDYSSHEVFRWVYCFQIFYFKLEKNTRQKWQCPDNNEHCLEDKYL